MLSHGASYGIYTPHKPISSDYFPLVKMGSYDGIIYLVKKNGAVQAIPGGRYFVSTDQRFLFSTHANDCDCGASVFDLKKEILLTTINTPTIMQWYQKAGTYFFTTPNHKNTVVYYLSPATSGAKVKWVQSKNITGWKQGAKPISYDFEPSAYKTCDSRKIAP